MTAAISLSDFTIHSRKEGEFESKLLVSPSTMDSGDTVDITTIMHGRKVVGLTGWDTTNGDSVTATFATTTDVITVDVGGSDTDAVYVLKLDLLHI